MGLLTAADKNEIADLVRKVEQTSAGELVVVVASRSGGYELVRSLVALCSGVALSAEVHRLDLGVDVTVLLWMAAGAAVAFYALLGWSPLLRWLVPPGESERRVNQRALAAFVEQGVTETEGRSGVLVFLSELERRIVILADKGIHERVPIGTWDQQVDALVRGIRGGAAKASLLGVIEELGKVLEQHFPAGLENRNELSDEVREVK